MCPTVTHGWWQKFLKRNPTRSLQAGDSIARIRMDAIIADNLKVLINSERYLMIMILITILRLFTTWMKLLYR